MTSRRLDHVANGDLAGRSSEGIAPVRAARAANNSGATQTQQDLFDVVVGEPLELGDLPAGDRAVGNALREMQRADDAVFRKSRDAHVLQSKRSTPCG